MDMKKIQTNLYTQLSLITFIVIKVKYYIGLSTMDYERLYGIIQSNNKWIQANKNQKEKIKKLV